MKEKDKIVARDTMKEIKKELKNGNERRAKELTMELLDYFGWPPNE